MYGLFVFVFVLVGCLWGLVVCLRVFGVCVLCCCLGWWGVVVCVFWVVCVLLICWWLCFRWVCVFVYVGVFVRVCCVRWVVVGVL